MVTPLDMKQVRKLLANFAIPPRPEMLNQLQKEIESEDPSLKTIASIIQQDVGIAGYTLQVVNSPLFSLPRKITSIEHACMYLGLTRLFRLVNSVVLRFTLSKGQDDPFTQKLWNSSTVIGAAAMALAKSLNLDDDIAEELYTIGLFHNAGKALILKQNENYPEILKQAYRNTEESIADFESLKIRASHELVGFLLAQSWGLTGDLSNVIAYHHSPNVIYSTGNQTEKQLLSVIKLAEHMTGLANVFGETRVDNEWDNFGEKILQQLNIEQAQLKELGEQIFEMGVENIYYRQS